MVRTIQPRLFMDNNHHQYKHAINKARLFRGAVEVRYNHGREGQEPKAGRNSQSVTTIADEVRRELNCSLDETLTSDIAKLRVRG